MVVPITLVPFVPGGPDFAKSRELFGALGFEEEWSSDGYAGFRAGGARPHREGLWSFGRRTPRRAQALPRYALGSHDATKSA